MKAKYFISGCKFCGTCLHECPVKAIRMTATGAVIDQEKCVACGRCYKNCASEAIKQVAASEEKAL